MYYIGYDIGGTKCAVSLGEANGQSMNVVAKRQFPTEGAPYEVLARMAEIAADVLMENGLGFTDIASAGISCGGPLNSNRGVILSPPNLPGWDEIRATEFLSEKTGVRTALQNDANACAVAEWLFGAGRGAKNMVFLTFGTGLGAGLILNGRLYSGASDMAGEVGHIRLASDGPEGYGKRGSAEGFCSGGGIARSCELAVKRAVEGGAQPAILKRGPITAKLVAEMAREGDELCMRVYEECGERLGMLLSFIMDMINPELIVLGGVYMRSSDLIIPSMERVIAREALPYAALACRIVPAGLGESVGDYAALSVAAM